MTSTHYCFTQLTFRRRFNWKWRFGKLFEPDYAFLVDSPRKVLWFIRMRYFFLIQTLYCTVTFYSVISFVTIFFLMMHQCDYVIMSSILIRILPNRIKFYWLEFYRPNNFHWIYFEQKKRTFVWCDCFIWSIQSRPFR